MLSLYEKINAIIDCVKSLEDDFIKDINKLTALLGGLLNADGALFNHIEGDSLVSKGVWGLLGDYVPGVDPLGHICHDIIQRGEEEIFIVEDLANSSYFVSDSEVKKYNLHTYVGYPVFNQNTTVGAVCVVYTKSHQVTMNDKLIISLIAMSLSFIEARRTEYLVGNQLQTQFDLVEAIIDGMPDIFGVQDLDHNILRYNKLGYDFLGKTPKEVDGHKCYELMNRDSECDECATRNALKSKKLEVIEKYIPDRDIYLECRSNPVLGKNGGILYMVEQLRDITIQKKALINNLEKDRILKYLYENMTDVVFMVDFEFNLQNVSPSIKGLTGFTYSEYMKKTPQERHPRATLEKFRAILNEELTNDSKDSSHTLRVRGETYRVDGSLILIEMHVKLVRDEDGKPTGIQGVSQDITDMYREEISKESLQSQLIMAQKMEAFGRLSQGLVHEFNNSLCVIQGAAEMALLTDTFDRDTILEIKEAAEKSESIIKQLSTFSDQPLEVKKTKLDVNKILNDFSVLIQTTLGANINLRLYLGESDDAILVNREQIEQIILNLCLNASDSIGSDKPGNVYIETSEIDFELGYTSGINQIIPGKYIMLSVTDNGKGFKEEELNQVFEPYYNGFGLTLTSVYGMVRNSGGFINVYSELGKGTIFKVYFPRHRKDEKHIIPELNGSRKTILLVDDNVSVANTISTMLRSTGHRVLEAHSPSQALEMCVKSKWGVDLLFTDIVMPEMNGHELYLKVKELFPNMQKIFMSSYNFDMVKDLDILSAGDKESFLLKPFPLSTIVSLLNTLLPKSKKK